MLFAGRLQITELEVISFPDVAKSRLEERALKSIEDIDVDSLTDYLNHKLR